MRASKTQVKLICVLMVVAAVLAPAARGATVRTWDGGGANNLWANATNWVGNAAPVAGDDLVFPANASVDATSLTSTNNFPANTAFRSITFQSGSTNYLLTGNAIVLTNAGVVAISGQSGGTNTVDVDIQLNTNQVFEQTAVGNLIISGGVNLNGKNLTNNVSNSTGRIEIQGLISGTGELVKTGVGTMLLRGDTDNTYNGLTRVSGGTLVLDDDKGVMLPGDLLITNATVRIDDLNGNEIVDTSNVTIRKGGLLDLNNRSEAIASLTIEGDGAVSTGTGTLTNGDITSLNSSLTANISGKLDLGGQIRTFNIGPGSVNPDLFISAVITNGGITKTGAGNLRLAGANTYSGLTTVSNGYLEVGNALALGSTNVGTVLEGGYLLLVSVSVAGEPLTNNSSLAEFRSNGSSGWAGRIVLNAELSVGTFGGTNDISGAISGIGDLTKFAGTGGGTLVFSGTSVNTYTGTTTVNDGTLRLSKSAGNASIAGPLIIGDGTHAAVVQIQTNSQIQNVPVTVNSNATFDVNGISETFGSLAGSGNVTLGGVGINFGGDNSSTTFSGVISETGNITKSGTGTMTMSGTNTFVGFTTVSAGTLLVNGSQPQSPINLNGTGTLGGTGIVGNISVNANLAPGASPGILTCSNLTFTSSGDYFVELNGLSPGTGYDQLKVRGTNNLANAVLHVIPGFTNVVPLGSQFIIITNDGTSAITGTFTGMAEGATLSTNGYGFQISYAGGSGNDVVLKLMKLPASDLYFTNAAGGDFLTALNWSPNFVPGEADNANFTNTISPFVTWSANRTNANAFFNAPSGVVTQSVGGFFWQLTNSYVVGQNAGSTATVSQVSGQLRVTNTAGTAALIIGQGSRGTYNLQGGTIIADRILATNNSPTLANSVFNFDSGTLTTLNNCVITQAASLVIGTIAGQPAAWNVLGGSNYVGIGVGNLVLGGPIGSLGAMLVSGPGTSWNQTRPILVGSNGSLSTLTITNGARVLTTGAIVGSASGCVSNILKVTDTNSLLGVKGTVTVGNAGAGNQMIVVNGGVVSNTTSAVLGPTATGDGNLVRISGPGSAWLVGSIMNVGSAGASNRIVIENGGLLSTVSGVVIGNTAGANTNSMLITDPGSLWTDTGNSAVGGSIGNSLIISNGGHVQWVSGAVGGSATASNSLALVTGSGSVWSASTSLIVGQSGSSASLVLTNGGSALAPSVIIGSGSATNSVLTVAGGTLHVTNVAATAVLEIRRGTNRLNSGVIEADSLLLTNTAGALDLNGGSFLVRNSSVTNGQPLVVGDGVGPAYSYYDLVGNGIHAFNDGLIVQSNAILYGTGTVIGPITVVSGGYLEPAGHTGKITLNSPPLLQGTVVVEIRRTGATVTNAQVQVNGGLTYGGNLDIVDDSPNPVVAGDRFPLFNASSYAGAFSNLNLPLLPYGLSWSNKLLIDGSIEVVVSPPSDCFWTNRLGGTYQTTGNWLDSLAPGFLDNAHFTNNANYQVTWAADAAAASAFFDGGTVTQSMAAFSWSLTNSYVVGTYSGSTVNVAHVSGTLQVTNSSGNGTILIGKDGNPTYKLKGGTVLADVLLVTNKNTSLLSDSTFTFDSGTLTTLHGSTIASTFGFSIGTVTNSTATWVISGGTNLATFFPPPFSGIQGMRIGAGNGSRGIVNVTGPGTYWEVDTNLDVGEFSPGSLTISNGAKVVAQRLDIGDSGIGNVSVNGPGASLVVTPPSANYTFIGNFSSSNVLSATEGAIFSCDNPILIGSSVGSRSNLLLLSGSGTILTNSATNGPSVLVGSSGSANSMVVSNGALAQLFHLTLGSSGGSSNNRVAISGTNTLLSVSPVAGISVGLYGSFNQMTLNDGATVRTVDTTIGDASSASNNVLNITDPGSIWSNRATLYVGASGCNNLMVVSNGASVFSQDANVGYLADSSNNVAIVTGTGSTWSNSASGGLNIGGDGVFSTGGSFNQLIITNSGTVASGSGNIRGKQGNTALVSGLGSVWTNTGNLFVGGQSSNQLVVSDGGKVFNYDGYVGGTNSTVFVIGSGSVWSNRDILWDGNGGPFSQVIVSNGGAVYSLGGEIGLGGYDNNIMTVTGSGSVWSNRSFLYVGGNSSSNQLIIENGGVVISPISFIGQGFSSPVNDTAIVRGTGSVWGGITNLTIGEYGQHHTLVISNGGAVFASGVILGANPSSTNNGCFVDNATLRITNVLASANFDIRRGTNQINNNAVVEADALRLTNIMGFFELNGGTLNVRTSRVSNTRPFFVGDGVSLATLNLISNGTHSFANGLTIRPDAWLTGSGSITGAVTVLSGAIVSPGTSIGKITLNNSPGLGGAILMEISKSGSVLTNDQITVNAPLTYGGTLAVVNIGPDTPNIGNRFKLFNATSYSGSFSTINFPALPAGLSWSDQLLLDGSIQVIAQTDFFFTNALGGNFLNTSNWLPNAVPGVTNNANFTNNASYQVSWTADVTNANALFNAVSGVVTQSLGAFSWRLTNSYILGQIPGATGSVTHASGNLRVTNSAKAAVLDVRRGTLRLNGGTTETDALLVTNIAGAIQFNGGTLITRGGSISNTFDFNVGAGGNTPAIWDVRAGNDFVLSANLVIGQNVVGSQMLITNGARVFDTVGQIGSGFTASNSTVIISGVGSMWGNAASLLVGVASSLNQLVISNNASAVAQLLSIGNSTTANSNRVVLDGAGAALKLTGVFDDLDVGDNGASGNQLVLSNGAALFPGDFGYLNVGHQLSASNNALIVDGFNTLITNASGGGTPLIVGYHGNANTALISGGARAYLSGLTLGGGSTAARGNRATIQGPNTFVDTAGVTVGAEASSNLLQVFNGAALKGPLTVGYDASASNNTAVISGPNSKLTNDSLYIKVGISSPGNLLLVANGGKVSANEVDVGMDASAINNQIMVTGAGSTLEQLFDISPFIVGGSFGSTGNSIVASNGATLKTYDFRLIRGNDTTLTGAGTLMTNRAYFSMGGRMVVSNGAVLATSGSSAGSMLSDNNATLTITDPGSAWFASGLGLNVGEGATNALLLVANGGLVSSTNIVVGYFAGDDANVLLLNGAGSQLTNAGTTSSILTIGKSGSRNQLVVTNGARADLVTTLISDAATTVLGGDSTAAGNGIFISGTNSRFASPTLIIGKDGRGNQVSVSDGALIVNGIATLGASITASSNSAVVAGPGSVWSNTGLILVGSNGPSTTLVVSNGAALFTSGLTVGYNSSSTNNSVFIFNAQMSVVNPPGNNAQLDVRRGAVTLNGGTLDVDQLLLNSGPQGVFNFNAGRINVGSSSVANGQAFGVGNGSAAATLNLLGNTHSFASGLTIRSNAFLIGNGLVTGPVTVLNGGSISPGTSVGRITLSTSPVLAGSLVMEVSKNGSVLTNDVLQINASLTYAGILTVSNIGPDTLVAGNRFKLFNASSFSGAFSTLNLPSLASGLTWTNQLLLDGSLQVIAISHPQFSQVSLAGTNLIFAGSGGISNGTFTILSSTNLALPVTNWTPLATNQFDGSGQFVFTNSVAPTLPQQFYMLRAP